MIVATEKTLAQVTTQIPDDGITQRVGLQTYKRYRELRVDPTIALGRALVVAPAVAADWITEGAKDTPQELIDFIDDNMQPMRTHLLRTALLAHVDFGWQGYEKILSPDATGKIVLRKLKPLLQDITSILADPKTGAFAGFFQKSGDTELRLEIEDSLLISIDVEGTQWYGQPLLENSRKACEKWDAVELAAARYDKKIAGAMIVIRFPEGQSNINGVLKDNSAIANDVALAIQASGIVCMPSKFQAALDDIEIMDTPGDGEKDGWTIDLLTDGSAGRGNFTERHKYLDSLKVRGLGLPERAVLEGQFGTKAESEAHADFAISNIEQRHDVVLQMVNWHCVNQLLRINFGEEFENKVWLSRVPLSDARRAVLKSLYSTLLTSPEGFAAEFDNIDTDAMREALGVPTRVATSNNPASESVLI